MLEVLLEQIFVFDSAARLTGLQSWFHLNDLHRECLGIGHWRVQFFLVVHLLPLGKPLPCEEAPFHQQEAPCFLEEGPEEVCDSAKLGRA